MSTTIATQASSSRDNAGQILIGFINQVEGIHRRDGDHLPVTYVICAILNLPLFTFHPATNRFAWGWEAGQEW